MVVLLPPLLLAYKLAQNGGLNRFYLLVLSTLILYNCCDSTYTY